MVNKQTNKQIVLASASPRRKQLLAQLGYDFMVNATNIEERRQPNELPQHYVNRLAIEKAEACLTSFPEAVVIGADTIVVIDGDVLEKPRDLAHSQQMLQRLSGQCHQVLTSVAVISEHEQQSKVITTKVWFKPLSSADIEHYWQTGEPSDKAGSYAIQGLGGKFVTRMEGSYHAVVGLPLYETDQLLHEFL